MSRTVQTSGPPGGAQRPPGIELSGFYLHGSRDPPSVSKHYLVLHGVVAAAVGGSIYSNFLFLEILSILPVVTGPMLVQWLGFSQEQALSSLLNISPPGMSKFPLPSPSCNADLSYSIAPAVTCLSPSGSSALGKDSYCGYSQETPAVPAGPWRPLTPVPELS